MSISVYLPDSLKKQFDAYVESKGMTTNGAIRKAVELLLKNDTDKKWGEWINHIEPDPDFPGIEELRKGLKDLNN